MTKCKLVATLFTAALSLTVLGSASAQSYPNRPVRMVVPYPAGGPLDALARIFAEKLAGAFAQPFVIENRAGANGNIGAESVARSAPDGYTLLWAIDTQITVNPALYPNMAYDPQKDLAPISLISTSDGVLVLHPSIQASNVKEFVALAKKQPLNYSSGGNGSPAHMAAELLMAETGISLVHVPYKGSGPVVASLLAGETQVSITSIPGVIAHIQSGRLKALAVTGSKRTTFLDQLPTFSEAGFPGVVIDGWRALYAPAGTPRVIIGQINRELVRIAKLPDVQERLAGIGTVAVVSTPEQLAALMQAETRKWTKVVKDANIKVQ